MPLVRLLLHIWLDMIFTRTLELSDPLIPQLFVFHSGDDLKHVGLFSMVMSYPNDYP
jgi:hypothetical protein